MTQLYAMLEQDPAAGVQIAATTCRNLTDLPRYFNKLISRSCVSLGDWHQVNTTLARNRGRGKCSTAVGWGSASCLNCSRNDIQQKVKSSGQVGLKNHQSSLVTLLNLTVDSCGYDTIYQLLDTSILLVEDEGDVVGTVSLAQKYVEPGDVDREESDEESSGREVIVSFQW